MNKRIDLLSLFALLEMLIVMPVAPWVVRMLLYIEVHQPERKGLTKDELFIAVKKKFTEKLLKDAPSDEQIRIDVDFLVQQDLITLEPGEKVVLSARGREIARELTSATVPA